MAYAAIHAIPDFFPGLLVDLDPQVDRSLGHFLPDLEGNELPGRPDRRLRVLRDPPRPALLIRSPQLPGYRDPARNVRAGRDISI